MSAPRSRPDPAKSGFALPMVLALVTILALIFAVAIVSLRSLREETLSSRDSVEFQRAAMTAEARMQYLALTEPFGQQGLRIGGVRAPNAQSQATYTDYLTLLGLDDKPYRWRESADNTDAPYYLASVQDEAGLVNIFQADSGMISRLFQAGGISADSADQLASELIDYNAQPSPHETMRRLAELYSLPSARDLITDKAWRVVSSLATVHPDSNASNINTAPADVLKIWFDIPDQQAQQAVADRALSPFTAPADLGVTVLNPNLPYAQPGGRLRFTFTDPKSGQVYRSTLVLAPTNTERPLFVENIKIQRQSPAPETSTDDLEDFPEIPASPS